MARPPTTLQVNLAPGDARYARMILPHQLRTWASQVDEVLLTVDTQRPRGRSRFGRDWDAQRPSLTAVLDEAQRIDARVTVTEVDYGTASQRAVGERFFGRATVPAKDSRGGPFFSYFFGLARARHDHVLHVDSDMLFGGGSTTWIEEAASLLENHADVIAVNPLGGPPTDDARARRDPPFGDTDRAFLCDSISSRVFFVDRSRLIERMCPLPLARPRKLRSTVKAFTQRNPNVALPEDLLTDAMHAASMTRIDLLGTPPGMWSVHPAHRSPAFFAHLEHLVNRIEMGDVTDDQRGEFDLAPSMLVTEERVGAAQ